MSDLNRTLGEPGNSSSFQTDWFTVRAAGHATAEGAQALEKLCRTYWYPLYAYVRRKGHTPEDAQDLTQEFFARLLEKPCLQDLHPSKGRFRSFLLAALNHFLANEWRREQAQKRGGGRAAFSLDALAAEDRYRVEPGHDESPDKVFERHWARVLLDQVLTQLEQEYRAAGKGDLFEAFKGTLDGERNPRGHGETARRLGMTEAALRKAAQRLRERYTELLRAEIAHTVTDPQEIEAEMHCLFTALHG